MVVDSSVLNTNEPVPTLPGEVMAPVEYSPAWLMLGIALLVLVALFYLFVWWFTRTRSVKPPAPTENAYDPGRYLIRVDTVEQRVRAGELSARDGYGELSKIIREAVSESTGIPAERMTLRDLRNTPLAHTSDAIEFFYPGVFAPAPGYDYPRALHLAKEVLHGWN